MNWFSKKINDWCKYHYPLHTWNKVALFFKKPKCLTTFNIWQGEGLGHRFPEHWWNYIIDIQSWDVTVTDKTQCGDINFRFDFTPHVSILFFRYFHLWFRFIPMTDKETFLDESLYWETIMTMINYNKSLYEAIELNTWYNTKKIKNKDGSETEVKEYFDAYRCGMLSDFGNDVYVTLSLEESEKNGDFS